MRDMQLLERGWERDQDDFYRERPGDPTSPWMRVEQARQLAGLDTAPESPPAPLRYTMTMTSGGGVVALQLTDDFVAQLRSMDVPIFPVTFATNEEGTEAVAFIERVIGHRIMEGWKSVVRH